jgi:hypothetical protein
VVCDLGAESTCTEGRFALATVSVNVVIGNGHVTDVARVCQTAGVPGVRRVELFVPNVRQQ